MLTSKVDLRDSAYAWSVDQLRPHQRRTSLRAEDHRTDPRGTVVSAIAATLEGFFTQRLVNQKRVSVHTMSAYRDTFRLLLGFASQRIGKRPCDLDFDDMRAALHSLAPLRISEPSFPWPPLAPLVTQTLAAHTSARTNVGPPRTADLAAPAGQRQRLHPQPSALRQVCGVFRLT